ncbi:MAG: LarC family nickel insertion protein [Gammaproteobacteria bacterium]
MAIHLDPVGGVAGDMFAAAVLDLRPDYEPALHAALRAAGLDELVHWTLEQHGGEQRAGDRHVGGAFVGRRVSVAPAGPQAHSHHRDFATIRELLCERQLDPAVRARAIDIFTRLAKAEGRVHGVPVDRVHFHEVGAWDSIADVVVASWLIEALGDDDWSASALPLGSGRVDTAHGRLPVPAPATAVLLEGMRVFDDGIPGERITPTGAAILAHLAPSFEPRSQPFVLEGSGLGFGSRVLDGVENFLRVLELSTTERVPGRDRVAVLRFEVDDQTAEDLAVALDNLRAAEGVLDVAQFAYTGKKGRQGTHVQLIASGERLPLIIDQCFIETTTLGVRYELCDRAVLPREHTTQLVDGREVEVKRVRRPGAAVTVKAGMDDVAAAASGRAERERVRQLAEAGTAADKPDRCE